MMGKVSDILKEHKNNILGFILGSVIFGTLLMLFQEQLKLELFSEDPTTVRIELISSTVSIFPSQDSYEFNQLIHYEISATAYLENIEIEIIFKTGTNIEKYSLLYSIDVVGHQQISEKENHLMLKPKHHLDDLRRIDIYLLTSAIKEKREDRRLELPQINVKGLNRDGKVVYK